MNKIKKIFLGVVFLSSILAAENYPVNNHLVQKFKYGYSANAAGYLNQIAAAIANQLGQNKDFYNVRDTPIAITSIVNLENLKEADKFGNVLSETLIHEMQVRGYRVVDFKTMKTIKIDKNGDYIFSRIISELKKEQNVNYVLSGTFTEYKDGVVVNCRIIDIKTNLVKSSAQVFVPNGLIRSVNLEPQLSYEDSTNIKIVKVIPAVEPYTITIR